MGFFFNSFFFKHYRKYRNKKIQTKLSIVKGEDLYCILQKWKKINKMNENPNHNFTLGAHNRLWSHIPQKTNKLTMKTTKYFIFLSSPKRSMQLLIIDIECDLPYVNTLGKRWARRLSRFAAIQQWQRYRILLAEFFKVIS